MSTSRAIKPKRDDTILSNWESQPERAPSIEREDRPTVARILALIGLFFLVLGGLAMLAPNWQRATLIAPAWGFVIFSLGIPLILLHAFAERDMQFRRLYAYLGLGLLLLGLITRFMALKGAAAMTWPTTLSGPEVVFFFSIPFWLFGLTVLVGVIRNESDVYFRSLLVNIIGGLGTIMIAFALFTGLRDSAHMYLPGEGLALLLLGLLFICAYIGAQESTSENGYRAALGLGAVGLIGFTVAAIRSFLPESTYLVPSGVIVMAVSTVYLLVAAGICIDIPVIVMTRRELASFFFSPVAYLVFIAQMFCGWIMFLFFAIRAEQGMLEPIIYQYIFGIFSIMMQSVLIPALTMRQLSEEKKAGTLEVLLTAPLNEISVVLSKFLGCWLFNMLLWIPWWLFLVSLRYMGAEEFDYRPMLSFTVALGATSAGFMAMGLFFSSLTSNQIIAAVFTFVGMLVHLLAWWAGSLYWEVLSYVSYFEFWEESLSGILSPRLVVFHLSSAIVFLFMTVKVLESRKWR